jgi:hypothetical protein
MGPKKDLRETIVTKEAGLSNHDMTSLVQLLIEEIKTTLHERIDLLNERLDLQNEENQRLKDENASLKSENDKLRQIVATQEKINAELQQKTTANIQPTYQQSQEIRLPSLIQSTQKKARGIKSHNLIFTYPENDEQDQKKVIEDIILSKFNRKPALNAVHMLHKQGQVSSDQPNYEKSQELKALVTFNSIWELKSIYRERVRALRNCNIYISEDLTRDEAQIFFLARKLKRNNLIQSTWTEEGDTYIVEQTGTIPRILTRNDPLLLKIEELPTTVSSQEEKKKQEKQEQNIFLEKTQELQESSSDSVLNVRLTRHKTKEINNKIQI